MYIHPGASKMYSDYSDKMIASEFDKIIKELENGTIWGKTMDMYDLKMLVVSAYYVGMFSGNEQTMDIYDRALKRVLDK